jgi:hypothetical protein
VEVGPPPTHNDENSMLSTPRFDRFNSWRRKRPGRVKPFFHLARCPTITFKSKSKDTRQNITHSLHSFTMGPDASLFHLHNNAPASLCALPPLPPVLPFKSLKILSHFLVLQSTKTIIVSLHSTCKERERVGNCRGGSRD